MAACEIRAKSEASCTLAEPSMPQPVVRQARMSLWSPKMESAWVATARAVTWKTVGWSSPAILNMLGTISNSPCDAVKVVAMEPVCNAPCTLPTAPPSLCNSTIEGMVPQRFLRFSDAHWSQNSPIGEEGVMG